MIAKFGYILLILLFGALMFAAGMFAPETLRQQSSQSLASLAQGQLPGLMAEAAKAGENADKVAATDAAKAVETNSIDQKQPPVPYASLLSSGAVPTGSLFALQAQLLAGNSGGETLLAQLKNRGYPGKAIDVVDDNGLNWRVIAVGEYKDRASAEEAQDKMMQALGSSAPLPVIVLPPEPPKS